MTTTTHKNLNELRDILVKQYTDMINAMPMKKNVRECLIDGYRQGVGEGITHTVKMLGVEVVK